MKKTKHVMIVAAMAVMLILETVAVTYGVQKVEEEYVEQYLEQQKQYMAQLNLHLQYMLEQGADQQMLVSYMAKNVPVSGSYYAWLTRDETVIFAKNETVTASLGPAEAWPVFQETVSGDETCSVSAGFSYNGTDYRTGMVIDRSYILAHKSLQRFEMYGAVSLSVLGLVMFSVLIVYIQGFWREKKKNISMAQELQSKNSDLEDIYGEMEELSRKLQKERQRPQKQRSYDLQMAKKLLEKSERADVQPVHYTAVQLQMDEGQYYGKQQIMDIMDKISLDERHVRMELQKGSFLVMFYRTGRAEMEEILKNAREEWKAMDVTLKLDSGVITPDTPERRWLDEFLAEKGKDV